MPFLCFEWFKLWLEHFLKDSRLLILLLYREGEIVTIVPFLIKEEKLKRINVRKIDLLGNVYSPIRYFLFSRFDDEERVKNLYYIFHFLSSVYKNWDILDLYAIPEENNCFNVLRMAIKGTGLRHLDYSCFGDWYLDEINFSWEQYFKKFNSKFRHNIRYRREKLEKAGNFEVKIIRSKDEAIDQYMDLYYEVYAKSWQKKEGVGPTFHLDLAKIAARNGWLRLGFLFLNGNAISSQFWLSCKRNAFILKTVYDQNYKEYSPGQILTTEMMKHVMDIDKVKMMDYLHGDESYKKEWTFKRRERKGILVYNNNIKGNYLGLLNNRILPLFNKYKSLKKIERIIVNRLG